jgi:hypothetical protein
MKKTMIALCVAVAAALASGAGFAQGHGGPGGGHAGGGHAGGGSSGGSHWNGGGHGGSWHGGYYGHGGYWHGGWYGPSLGFYFGAPWYWGGWPYGVYDPYPYGYGYSYSYAPAPAYQAPEATFYVTPAPAATPPADAPTNYWYYCTNPAGYYPYVQNCTKAWMQVVPQGASN